MPKHKCFSCGKIFISRSIPSNKPVVCSKECSTENYKREYNNWLIETRGYPRGYKSVEHYLQNSIVDKTCVNCSASFKDKLKNNKIYCEECIEQQRIEKIKNTKFERYGSCGFNNRDKSKETNLKKYGVDNVFQSENIMLKAKQTLLEKYGVDNIAKKRDFMESAYMRFLGVKNPQQLPEINKKTLLTRSLKYELQGAVPKEKLEKTCLEKYGTNQFFSSEKGKMSYENLMKTYNWTEDQINILSQKKASCSFSHYIKKYPDDVTKAKLLYEERIKKCNTSSFEWALKKSNNDIEQANKIYINRITTKFNNSYCASKISLKTFKPVEEYVISQFGISPEDIYVNDGIRKEFYLWDNIFKRIYFYDFTIRSKKIIIEFNGCWFHAKTREENPESFDRDQRKLNLAKENGFITFVVWDDCPIRENQKKLIEGISKWLKM